MYLLPTKNGTLWCRLSGCTFSIEIPLPLHDRPPATSTINANGLHSYINRNLPLGLFTVLGYMKIPPLIRLRCTSATMQPIYRCVYGPPLSFAFCWHKVMYCCTPWLY